MTKEALTLALEALETCDAGDYSTGHVIYPSYDEKAVTKAITAIKEALAQPEQEPVATDWERIARVQDAKLRAMCNEAGGFEKLCEVMDKYERTTPPQRKPLTDEQIMDIAMNKPFDSAIGFARAIEAKLKEKNT